MAIRLSTGLRNLLLGGSGAGDWQTLFTNSVIKVYTGAQPTTADAAVTGTFLGNITVDGGAFSHGSATNGLNWDDPVAGVISKAAAEDWILTGAADGVAGWARLCANANDDGTLSTTLPRVDFAIGVQSGEIRITNQTIADESLNTVSIGRITLPAS